METPGPHGPQPGVAHRHFGPHSTGRSRGQAHHHGVRKYTSRTEGQVDKSLGKGHGQGTRSDIIYDAEVFQSIQPPLQPHPRPFLTCPRLKVVPVRFGPCSQLLTNFL